MKQPSISEIRSVVLPEAIKDKLDNGVELIILPDHQAEYLRLDVVFDAGRRHETEPLTSKSAALLMKEGCLGLSGRALSDQFESRGSSLNIRTSMDHTFLSFICIEDHAHDLLEIVTQVITSPSYDVDEVEKFKRRQSRKLDIELRKTEVMAYREMTDRIYGPHSAYGYNSTKALYQALDRKDVVDFHKKHLKHGKKWVFLSGRIGDSLLTRINQTLGSIPHRGADLPATISSDFFEPGQTEHITMSQSVQSSIRLFRPLFNRHHEDYASMFLMSIVLGGYFGSRLMKNIREEEGLTYGIYSSFDTLFDSGYLYISTETKHENGPLVVDLILKEMKRLADVSCSEQELLMVKRYISGQFLRMADGPLNVIKVYRTLALDGLNSDFYDELLHHIWRCSPHDLQETARSYLRPDQFSLLTVGQQNETALRLS